MSLKYIFDRVASESGITSPNLNEEQKARLLDVINQAAEEVYEDKDLPLSLLEVFLKANSNKQLALPSFIGETRAIRSTQYNDTWKLLDIRPRYHAKDWPNEWKNWRLIRYSPVKIEITNSAPGTIIYPVIDTNLNITIVGETTQSNRFVDKISMTATSKVWTSTFLSITRIAKNKVTDYNVTIKDADGNEMAVIYADQEEARYQIVDVSKCPDLSCCPDGTYIMEVLYKPRLQRMENDDDSFPVDGFDNIIVAKAKQLIYEELEGQEEKAILADRKVNRLINRKVEHKVGTTQKFIKFGRNKKLGLFRKYSNYDTWNQ